MEVYERLDDLADLIEGARGVPLSDSCMVNRALALDLIEAVRALMPPSLRDAAMILADRDDVLEDASREAESTLAAAREEVDALLARANDEAVVARSAAQAQAEEIVEQARREAQTTVERGRAEAERLVAADSVRLEAERVAKVLTEQSQAEGARIRAEADIYVDKRLAQLEDTLRAALDQVGRGRRRTSAAAERPAATPAASSPPTSDGIYDFAQDPEVAGELVGGRRRGNR